jgi:hypothetical protein
MFILIFHLFLKVKSDEIKIHFLKKLGSLEEIFRKLHFECEK